MYNIMETDYCLYANFPEVLLHYKKYKEGNNCFGDAAKEFNLTKEQTERMRLILLYRGVNKWLYCRRLLIDFKHQVKDLLET